MILWFRTVLGQDCLPVNFNVPKHECWRCVIKPGEMHSFVMWLIAKFLEFHFAIMICSNIEWYFYTFFTLLAHILTSRCLPVITAYSGEESFVAYNHLFSCLMDTNKLDWMQKLSLHFSRIIAYNAVLKNWIRKWTVVVTVGICSLPHHYDIQ